MNTSMIQGRLTRDVELSYTNSGTAVAKFSIAVDRPFKNAQGERETDFINIVAWRKTAEVIAEYFSKGSGIIIQGRIQTRNYENKQGQKVYVTEVVADNFSFPIQNKQEQNKSYDENRSNSSNGNNSQTNSNSNFEEDPFKNNDDSIDISDDDLPFD